MCLKKIYFLFSLIALKTIFSVGDLSADFSDEGATIGSYDELFGQGAYDRLLQEKKADTPLEDSNDPWTKGVQNQKFSFFSPKISAFSSMGLAALTFTATTWLLFFCKSKKLLEVSSLGIAKKYQDARWFKITVFAVKAIGIIGTSALIGGTSYKGLSYFDPNKKRYIPLEDE